MYKDLYQFLSKKKLISSKSIVDFCYDAPFEELVDIISSCFLMTNQSKNKISPSLFNFSASLTLGGGDFPCSYSLHRLDRIWEIARFSSLFADSVRIHNPFDYFYNFAYSKTNKFTKFYEGKFREDSIVGLSAVKILRPLVEAEIVYFSRTMFMACKECLKKKEKASKDLGDEMFRIGMKEMSGLIKDKINIQIPSNKKIILVGSKEFVGEDIVYSSDRPLKILKNNNGKIVLKTNGALWQSIITDFINGAIDSIMFQKIDTLEHFSETYLTSNAIERFLLNKLNKKSKNITDLVINNVPIIGGIDLNRTLEIRNSNQTSFNSFRKHIEELSSKTHGFDSSDDLNEWVLSEMKDELSDLRNVQEKSRKRLIRKGLTNGFFLGASIALSSFTNFDIPQILGLLQSLNGCAETVHDVDNFQRDIEKNPLYFYFKIEDSINSK